MQFKSLLLPAVAAAIAGECLFSFDALMMADLY